TNATQPSLAPATNPSVTGGSIFIQAAYLNVNGLIQSGKSSYSVDINAAAALGIGQIIAHHATGTWTVSSASNSDFTVKYDVDHQRIVVQALDVSGGSITVKGQIYNTGGGALKALGLYANVSIVNETQYDMLVNPIDTS